MPMSESLKVNSRFAPPTAPVRSGGVDAVLLGAAACCGVAEPGCFEDAAVAALAEIAAHVGADAVCLYLLSDDKLAASRAHLWRGVISIAETAIPSSLNLKLLPWLGAQIHRGGPIAICDAATLPAEATLERALFSASGLRALQFVPLTAGGAVAGVAALGYLHAAGALSPGDAQVVQAAGAVLLLAARHQGARARATEAERASRLWRFAIDQMPDGALFLRQDGTLLDASESACRQFGYSRAALLQRSLRDLVPSFSDAVFKQRWAAMREAGSVCFETQYRTADDRVFPAEVRSHILPLSSGECACAIFRDLTDRKWTEDMLRRSLEEERELSARLTALQSVAGELTACDTVDELCRAAVELGRGRLGFDRLGLWLQTDTAGVIEGTFGTTAAGETRDERGIRAQVLKGGLIETLMAAGRGYLTRGDTELYELRRDGSGDVWEVVGRGARGIALLDDGHRPIGYLSADMLITGRPIRRQDGELLGLYSHLLGHLLTRLRSQHSLVENERRMREFADNVPHLLWIKRAADMGVVYVNRAFDEIMGCSRDILAEDPVGCFAMVHPHDRERIAEALQRCTRERTACEFRVIRPDGRVRWLRDTGGPIRNPDGKIDYIAGIAEDITEQKRIENQLRQSERLEAIGRLAGGVAHDFNNLLTAMHGYLELAEVRTADEEQRGFLLQLRETIDRAGVITGELLGFARRQIIDPQVLNLNDVTRALEPLLRRVVGEHVALVIRLEEALWPVKADPLQLERVLLNLAGNARDAMPHGGRLTIETQNAVLDESVAARHADIAPGEYVLLAVTDAGSGIAAEDRERIFDPFFTTKGDAGGTGLGLSSVLGMVKQNQGHIWVYSEAGHGTAFKIYLPRAAGAVQPYAPKAAARPTSGSETILVVEDDQRVREVTVRSLRDCGYDVFSADGPVAAIDILKQASRSIALVVSDVMMPRMNGPELLQLLREQQPTLEALFVSGYPDEAIARQNVLASGANFLQKPYSTAVLAARVRQILDARPAGRAGAASR